MVSLNEKRSKIRYVVQNKTEWVDGMFSFNNKSKEINKNVFLFWVLLTRVEGESRSLVFLRWLRENRKRKKKYMRTRSSYKDISKVAQFSSVDQVHSP